MSSFPKPDARVKAVLASLAAVAALATLVVWRPAGILSVVLALVCVLLGMVAGVTVTAARQAPRSADAPTEDWPSPAAHGVDADTLEAIDPRAVRRLRTPGGYAGDADTLETLDPRAVRELRAPGGGYPVDADTLGALDPRTVREQRTANGVSDR
ncbi:hypothetical protein AB0F68_08630 [Micromonospora sp. NPDC023966]|uniref:hypothetical protein n=1 Tax=Micromonospora sp. NPDC023966 TaxID=3154699 RepID=UPI003402EF0D